MLYFSLENKKVVYMWLTKGKLLTALCYYLTRTQSTYLSYSHWVVSWERFYQDISTDGEPGGVGLVGQPS